MKRMAFGISMLIGGFFGIVSSLFIVISAIGSLGTLNNENNILYYLRLNVNFFGITPFFVCCAIMSIIGLVICVKEAYLSKQ